jgi:hypothetical protein
MSQDHSGRVAAEVWWSVAVVRGQSGIAHCRAFPPLGHYRSKVAACSGTGAGFASARSISLPESDRCRESRTAVSPLLSVRGAIGLDVLVESQHVVWVVLFLDLHEASIVRPIA